MSAEDPARLHELHRLLNEADRESFDQFVTRERADKSLRNDDVAIMRIAIDSPPLEATAA